MYNFFIIIIYMFLFDRFISSRPANIKKHVKVYEYILVFIKIAI